MHLRVLESETFEGMKLGVHGLALGLSALMCAYNAAAWLQRRQRHLAVNTLVYAGAIVLEQQHVAHHWRTLRRLDRVPRPQPMPTSPVSPSPLPKPGGAPSETRRAA